MVCAPPFPFPCWQVESQQATVERLQATIERLQAILATVGLGNSPMPGPGFSGTVPSFPDWDEEGEEGVPQVHSASLGFPPVFKIVILIWTEKICSCPYMKLMSYFW